MNEKTVRLIISTMITIAFERPNYRITSGIKALNFLVFKKLLMIGGIYEKQKTK